MLPLQRTSFFLFLSAFLAATGVISAQADAHTPQAEAIHLTHQDTIVQKSIDIILDASKQHPAVVQGLTELLALLQHSATPKRHEAKESFARLLDNKLHIQDDADWERAYNALNNLCAHFEKQHRPWYKSPKHIAAAVALFAVTAGIVSAGAYFGYFKPKWEAAEAKRKAEQREAKRKAEQREAKRKAEQREAKRKAVYQNKTFSADFKKTHLVNEITQKLIAIRQQTRTENRAFEYEDAQIRLPQTKTDFIRDDNGFNSYLHRIAQPQPQPQPQPQSTDERLTVDQKIDRDLEEANRDYNGLNYSQIVDLYKALNVTKTREYSSFTPAEKEAVMTFFAHKRELRNKYNVIAEESWEESNARQQEFRRRHIRGERKKSKKKPLSVVQESNEE